MFNVMVPIKCARLEILSRQSTYETLTLDILLILLLQTPRFSKCINDLSQHHVEEQEVHDQPKTYVEEESIPVRATS